MSLTHLIDITSLNRSQIESLIYHAQQLSLNGVDCVQSTETLANLFFENSTRTLVSFELAGKRLGMTTINLDIDHSSTQKGETILDTVWTLEAMGCTHFVIRHSESGIPAMIADGVGEKSHVINAGDGMHAHPTQALLDMLTIYQHKQQFEHLSVGIFGDIKHSRVANSQLIALKKLGVKDIRIIAPEQWLPENNAIGEVSDNMDSALKGLDVVMLLRVQKERIDENDTIDFAEYQSHFQLTTEKLRLAKPDAIVMHPGPMNRGIEISSEVADGPQSVILQQVANGVKMRMAILSAMS